jgi:hypothetical protein
MKRLLVVLALMAITVSHSAFAGWNTVKVTFSGMHPDGIVMKLTYVSGETSFDPRNFKLADDIAIEGLAISMAALSANKQLSILSDIDTVTPGHYPIITSILLNSASSLE